MRNVEYFTRQKKGYLLRLSLLIVDSMPWWLEIEKKDIYMARKSELSVFLEQIYNDFWGDYKIELMELERRALKI